MRNIIWNIAITINVVITIIYLIAVSLRLYFKVIKKQQDSQHKNLKRATKYMPILIMFSALFILTLRYTKIGVMLLGIWTLIGMLSLSTK